MNKLHFDIIYISVRLLLNNIGREKVEKSGFSGFFTDKQTNKHKISEKKVAQDTPRTNTDIVCEFQPNRFGSLGAYSEHTNKHTHTNTATHKKNFIYSRDTVFVLLS